MLFHDLCMIRWTVSLDVWNVTTFNFIVVSISSYWVLYDKSPWVLLFWNDSRSNFSVGGLPQKNLKWNHRLRLKNLKKSKILQYIPEGRILAVTKFKIMLKRKLVVVWRYLHENRGFENWKSFHVVTLWTLKWPLTIFQGWIRRDIR